MKGDAVATPATTKAVSDMSLAMSGVVVPEHHSQSGPDDRLLVERI